MDCKLIAFIGRTDYVQTAYSELRNRNDIILIKQSCFELYRHICGKLHIRPLYFVYHLLSFYFYLKYFRRKKKYVLLFHGVDYLWMLDIPLINFVKKKRDLYLVGYFWDVIDFIKYSVPQYRDRFDIVFTIDEQLAYKYGCQYYPIFYSKEDSGLNSEECDVFFCGEDGGRLQLLETIYSTLTSKGLSCDFYCSKSVYDGKIINGIKHIKRMPHSIYISHIKSCKVILDIVKPGVSCCSLRFSEGVIYDKKVLTNNPSILNQSFYNKQQFYVFDESCDIDDSFFEEEPSFVESNKYEVTPNRFVDYIYQQLNIS